jgi:hypothetical protein
MKINIINGSEASRLSVEIQDLSFRDLAICSFFSHGESLIVSLLILVGIETASKAVICWSFTKGYFDLSGYLLTEITGWL